MSRYIDADDVIRKIILLEKFTNTKFHITHNFISTQPTADVREVVRGEWIKFDEGNTFCSQCGYELEDWTQGIFYSYCPNCGADMRGKEE